MSNVPPPFDPNIPTAEVVGPHAQMPPHALGYTMAEGSRRPGLLTALAIISIVMAALSLLMAVITGFQVVWMQMLPNVMRTVTVATATPTTGPTVTTTTTIPAANPFVGTQWNIPMLIAGGTEVLLRIGLAILLLVAGILVLRDSRSARRLHLLWVTIRVPVALLGAWVYYQMMESMMSAMATMPGGPPPGSATTYASLSGAVFNMAFALAYPIAVVIVLNLRKIKDYYQGLRA